jgi:hypothetical protein
MAHPLLIQDVVLEARLSGGYDDHYMLSSMNVAIINSSAIFKLNLKFKLSSAILGQLMLSISRPKSLEISNKKVRFRLDIFPCYFLKLSFIAKSLKFSKLFSVRDIVS